MAYQGRYQTSFFSFLIFTFALIITGCTSGEDSGGGNSQSAAGYVEIEADAGTIVNLELDNTIPNPPPVVATLDGSDSTPQGAVTYLWSFTHKPDLSNTVLQNPTSASPSFVADVKGSYMVQLVVTSQGVVSTRDIALVEAVYPNERPSHLHIGLASRCSNCHHEGSQNTTKSGDHSVEATGGDR